MGKLAILSIAAALAANGMTATDEILSFDDPDGFTVGYQARDGDQAITELVRSPETVHNWSELVTAQTFYGLVDRSDAWGFYRRWEQRLKQACPGLKSKRSKGLVDGQPAVRGSLSCPFNPATGKPENIEAVVIEGQVNLLMLQIAFRRPLSETDRASTATLFSSIKVCDGRDKADCEARGAEGFQPNS